MSAQPCTVCEFQTFWIDLDEKGRCAACAPQPGWRRRIARRLAAALARVSTWVGGQ